jgi:restriction endonuclease S subunit
VISKEANETPNNWQEYRLGELLKIINGRAYKQEELLDTGTPVLRIQNLNGGDRWYYSDLNLPSDKYCTTGDLLFAWSATFGPYIYNGPKAIYHYHIWKVEVSPNLDQRFAYYLLSHITNKVKAAGRGISMIHMTKAGMEEWPVSVPPLPEQKRIAAILDQADALRKARRRAIERLNDLSQSIFYEMFGDPAKSSLFPCVKISTVCRKVTDGTHQSPDWAEQGIPFVFVSNVRNQSISLNTTKFLSEKTYEELTKNTPVEVGDVLYTAVGSYGNAAVVDFEEKFLFQRHIAHLKPDKALIDSTYLSYALESPLIKRQADSAAKGIAQKTVTLSDLKDFDILLPPLDCQRLFSEKIYKSTGHLKVFKKHYIKLDALFCSLQQRAFQGEL